MIDQYVCNYKTSLKYLCSKLTCTVKRYCRSTNWFAVPILMALQWEDCATSLNPDSMFQAAGLMSLLPIKSLTLEQLLWSHCIMVERRKITLPLPQHLTNIAIAHHKLRPTLVYRPTTWSTHEQMPPENYTSARHQYLAFSTSNNAQIYSSGRSSLRGRQHDDFSIGSSSLYDDPVSDRKCSKGRRYARMDEWKRAEIAEVRSTSVCTQWSIILNCANWSVAPI